MLACSVQEALTEPCRLLAYVARTLAILDLQNTDFHETLFPTIIHLCVLDSAFHLPCDFSQEGLAFSRQHATRKTIPLGAPLLLLLIFKCFCFKSFSLPPLHISYIQISFPAYEVQQKLVKHIYLKGKHS